MRPLYWVVLLELACFSPSVLLQMESEMILLALFRGHRNCSCPSWGQTSAYGGSRSCRNSHQGERRVILPLGQMWQLEVAARSLSAPPHPSRPQGARCRGSPGSSQCTAVGSRGRVLRSDASAGWLSGCLRVLHEGELLSICLSAPLRL